MKFARNFTLEPFVTHDRYTSDSTNLVYYGSSSFSTLHLLRVFSSIHRFFTLKNFRGFTFIFNTQFEQNTNYYFAVPHQSHLFTSTKKVNQSFARMCRIKTKTTEKLQLKLVAVVVVDSVRCDCRNSHISMLSSDETTGSSFSVHLWELI